jgi:hypothetical protein
MKDNMNRKVLEIEKDIMEARRMVVRLNSYLLNLEMDLVDIKIGLSIDDKDESREFFVDLSDTNNPYHGAFGYFIDYWKEASRDVDQQAEILRDRFDVLIAMLKEKYNIGTHVSIDAPDTFGNDYNVF